MGTWSEIVGRRCRGYSDKHRASVTFLIESYDRSHGFWVVNIHDPEDRHDISERAIGRTFHLVEE